MSDREKPDPQSRPNDDEASEPTTDDLWRREKPLRDRTVVITRAKARGVVLQRDLEELGARVIPVPCIHFGPPEDLAPVHEALQHLERYTWVLLTSATAVNMFFDMARELGIAESTWNRFRFGIVGPTTASQLASAWIHADRIIVAASAASLGYALVRKDGAPQLTGEDRCLFPQADIGRTDLQDHLRSAAITVDTVIAYRTLPEPREKAQPFLDAIEKGETIDAIAFASPSAYHNLLTMTEPDGLRAIVDRRIPLFSIGPTTSHAIREGGLTVAGEASPHTSGGLLQAVVRYLTTSG